MKMHKVKKFINYFNFLQAVFARLDGALLYMQA